MPHWQIHTPRVYVYFHCILNFVAVIKYDSLEQNTLLVAQISGISGFQLQFTEQEKPYFFGQERTLSTKLFVSVQAGNSVHTNQWRFCDLIILAAFCCFHLHLGSDCTSEKEKENEGFTVMTHVTHIYRLVETCTYAKKLLLYSITCKLPFYRQSVALMNCSVFISLLNGESSLLKIVLCANHL